MEREETEAYARDLAKAIGKSIEDYMKSVGLTLLIDEDIEVIRTALDSVTADFVG